MPREKRKPVHKFTKPEEFIDMTAVSLYFTGTKGGIRADYHSVKFGIFVKRLIKIVGLWFALTEQYSFENNAINDRKKKKQKQAKALRNRKRKNPKSKKANSKKV